LHNTHRFEGPQGTSQNWLETPVMSRIWTTLQEPILDSVDYTQRAIWKGKLH
jgi:hypothetical protein